MRAPGIGGALLASLGALGCASVSAPPGGVQTKIPPIVVAVTPDSGATNVRPPAVEFRFDKVVNNPPPGSQTSLNQLFVISPMDGTPRVSWHRDRIDVRPRHGFQANTAYSVTMLPGVVDLQSNVSKATRTIVFSTGPTIPPLGIVGRVFDWAAGTPAAGAWVQAMPTADTNTVYVAPTDSSGQFNVGPLSAGTYLVRGFIDADHNRALGRSEKWAVDTVVLSATRPAVELDAIERDTTPPRITTVQPTDSVTLSVTFDMALDPANQLTPATVRVQRADSVPLTVLRVETQAAAEQARMDSTRRADSLKATASAPQAGKAASDTSSGAAAAVPPAPPTPKPRQPAPSRSLVVHLAPTTPLVPGQRYIVSVRGIRNLRGRDAPTSRIFTAPKPEARPTPPAPKPPDR